MPACERWGRWLIPGRGTCLGCGPGPQWVPSGARESQPHIDVSLPLFLLSLKINKIKKNPDAQASPHTKKKKKENRKKKRK